MKNQSQSKFSSAYQSAAFIFFNSLLLFIFLNFILAIVYFFVDKKDAINGAVDSYDEYPLSQCDTAAYGDLPFGYVREINADFNRLARQGLYYQPWVQYSEPLFKGVRLNIITDETGIPMRYSPNPENKENYPLYKIYCFGGSTTFGYNVSDEQTYPYFLSKVANDSLRLMGKKAHVEVVNYGRGYYHPSEELQLLIDLLKLGHRPSLVLFMDGLNMGLPMDVPFATETVVNRFYDAQFRPDNLTGKQAPSKLPIIRLAKYIRKKLDKNNESEIIEIDEDLHGKDEIQYLVNRFIADKKIAQQVCAYYKIPCAFFSQPVAPYNYAEEFYRDYPFREDSGERIGRSYFISELLKRDSEIVSLHGLFKEWNRKAIVDYAHYSPAFNEFIAKHVWAEINLEKLLSNPFVLDSTQATGRKRDIAQKIYELNKKNNVEDDQLKMGD